MRSFVRCLTWAALFVCLLINSAWAASEREPNDSCRKAQNVGKIGSSGISGVIEDYDADYFKVTRAHPGQQLKLRVTGQSTRQHAALSYPSVWVYDSLCTLKAYAYAYDYESVDVVFTIPADGQYVVEVTGCCDSDPQYNWSTGAYVLTSAAYIAPPDIHGTVSYPNGQPAGNVWVDIYQCASGTTDNCSYDVAWTSADSNGQYSISTESLNTNATYQVVATDSSGTANARSESFTIGRKDIQIDLTLVGAPLALLSINWTGIGENQSVDLASGESTSISANLTNRSDETLVIDAWLMVYAEEGSGQTIAQYQFVPATGPAVQTLTLGSGVTETVQLPFSIPSGALSGVGGNVTVFLSEHGKPMQSLAGGAILLFEVKASGSAALMSSGASQIQQRKKLEERRSKALAQMQRRIHAGEKP